MNELKILTITGETVYGILSNGEGLSYNNNTDLFETPVTGNWPGYAISLTEVPASSGIYYGSMPDNIPTDVYSVLAYRQLGGSPAVSDTQLGTINIKWNGYNIPGTHIQIPPIATGITAVQSTGNASIQPTFYPNQQMAQFSVLGDYAGVNISWTQPQQALFDYWIVSQGQGASTRNGMQFRTAVPNIFIPQCYYGFTYVFGISGHRLHDGLFSPTAWSSPITIH